MAGLLPRLRDALRPTLEVRSELSSGGMARVFVAHDPVLDRDVAVKVLRPELATAAGAERFLREARLLARVNHPNVVAVHDVGEQDGLYCCVMELVAGQTLEDRLEDAPLEEEEVLRLGDGLLAALDAAHAEGVIHRDVKPANVILTDDGRVVLVDFGVARSVVDTDPGLTAPEGHPGTPAWMAPEQLDGEAATARTDLYSVARLLYEAATGRRWAGGADPRHADWSGMPGRLQHVLARGLEPAPGDRWPDAEAFRQALAGARRGRRWPAVAASLAVAGLLGLGALRWSDGSGSTPGAPAYDVAVLPCEAVATADSLVGKQVARVASIYLDHLPRLAVVPHFRTFRWWYGTGAGAEQRYAASARELDAAHVVRCTVEPAAEGRIRIGVELMRPDGTLLPPSSVEAPGGNPPVGAGDALGLAVVRMLRPRLVMSEEGHTALAGHDREAVRAFLLGEDAFQRDARPRAAEYYQAALAIDPTLSLARWRLVDLRRYLLLPGVEADLAALREERGGLGPVDRLMLEARLAPPGPLRLARYRELLDRFPSDPYARFTYGDELFHRGPLFGIGQDSASAVLRSAAARDSFLAPAWDHLAMALVRAGEREEAARAIDRLAALKGMDAPLSVDHPALLRHAWLERFEPERAGAARAELFDTGGHVEVGILSEAARLGGPYMDLPRAEAALGRSLAASAQAGEVRASGLVAEGLGLVAGGRWEEALDRFDRAAALAGGPDLRLHSALWRVVPPALGLEGVAADERERGRGRLANLAADASVPDLLRARAAWALGLDATTRGDDAGARDRIGQIEALAPVSGVDRALSVLRAWRVAATGEAASALARTEPVLAYRGADRTEWPFLPTALHLGRGRWLAATGRSEEAGRALLWHEAVDLSGVPTGPAQAGEIGWALGAHVDLLQARLHRDGGRHPEACRLAERVLYRWSEPDTVLAGELREARSLRQASCST